MNIRYKALKLRNSILTLIISVICVLLLCTVQTYQKNTKLGTPGDIPEENYCNLKLNTPHTPISIIGNAQLTEANGVKNESALGTKDDPFIIENYTISQYASNGAIYLDNITAHVIIRGCNVGWSATNGIHIKDSANITIHNNSVSDYSYGIRIRNSANITVQYNYGYDHSMGGIWMEQCNNTIVQNNELECSDSGIVIKNTRDSLIRNNDCHDNNGYGIELNGAENCLIKENENSKQNNGMGLFNTQFCNITKNHCHHNKYYGLQFQSGSGNNSVYQNDLIKNYWNGLYLYTYQDNEIYENNLCLNGKGPFDYSQSYADNLYDNSLKCSNEMEITDLPKFDLDDNRTTFSRILAMKTFETESAGNYSLFCQLKCKKEDSEKLIIVLEAYIETLSGSFYQITGAEFIYDVSVNHESTNYVGFGYKWDSTSTMEFSSKIYDFPMCWQELETNSNKNEVTISISYQLRSSKWDNIETTFSETVEITFEQEEEDDQFIGGFQLWGLIIPFLGLIAVVILKRRFVSDVKH